MDNDYLWGMGENQVAHLKEGTTMKLISRNGITTRNDGLPYDVCKTTNGYQFRAIGNPAKPVVIATTKFENDAIKMLVLQAPENLMKEGN